MPICQRLRAFLLATAKSAAFVFDSIAAVRLIGQPAFGTFYSIQRLPVATR
jgi:hypothetical protein